MFLSSLSLIQIAMFGRNTLHMTFDDTKIVSEKTTALNSKHLALLGIDCDRPRFKRLADPYFVVLLLPLFTRIEEATSSRKY